MGSLQFDLHAVGVHAPGLRSLGELLAVCRSGRPPDSEAVPALPAPAELPPNERRRASQVVRLTLTAIDQALQGSPFPAESLRSVFATDEGTGEICQQLMETVATTRQVSPLLFPNSVHNAPSGHFALAWRNRQPSTVASLGLESFASGLLCAASEASATAEPVLFVAYDPALTSPIDELLPVTQPSATAWILCDHALAKGKGALCSLRLNLGPAGSEQPTPLPPWLPSKWASNSSARALAALGLLDARPGTVQRLALGSQLLRLSRFE
jgi:hypothetical protein